MGRNVLVVSTVEHSDDILREHVGDADTVKVVVHQPSTRWYSGAGIYRHVWLTIADPVHVAQWGTSVTTPEIRLYRLRTSDPAAATRGGGS